METVGTRSGEEVSAAIEAILYEQGEVTAFDLAGRLEAPLQAALHALESCGELQLKFEHDPSAYVRC